MLDVAVATTKLLLALSNAFLIAVIGELAARSNLFLAIVSELLGVSWVGV